MLPTHRLHAKYLEQRAFYDSYKYKKCLYPLFRARFVKWIPIKEAISPLNLKVKAKRCNEDGRQCNRCWVFKHWTLFSKMSNWINGRSPDCLDCRNIKHRKERENKALQKQEKEYKRIRRANEEWKTKTFLDNLYYQDPRILKNREILKSISKIDRKKSLESKIDWLINKGYNPEILQKIYNTTTSYNRNYITDTRY